MLHQLKPGDALVFIEAATIAAAGTVSEPPYHFTIGQEVAFVRVVVGGNNAAVPVVQFRFNRQEFTAPLHSLVTGNCWDRIKAAVLADEFRRDGIRAERERRQAVRQAAAEALRRAGLQG